MALMRADVHERFLAIRDRALAKHEEHLDRLRPRHRGTYRKWNGKVAELSDTPRWKPL